MTPYSPRELAEHPNAAHNLTLNCGAPRAQGWCHAHGLWLLLAAVILQRRAAEATRLLVLLVSAAHTRRESRLLLLTD